jgi:hypothetical protein
MNIDYILKEIRSYSETVFERRIIEEVPEFQEVRYVSSVDSLLLQTGGHSPIKQYSFSLDKLTEWCEENNIDCWYDGMERLYRFKNI